MPTGGADGEFQALDDNCDWTWKDTAPKGYLMTGKGEYAGISVFFPAAGTGNGTSLDFAGSDGFYWSSSLYSPHPDRAYSLGFTSGGVGSQSDSYRYCGGVVRPVSD